MVINQTRKLSRAGIAVPRASPDDAFSASRCWTCCCTRFSFPCRCAVSSRSFGTAYVLTAVCGCKAEKNKPSLVLIPKTTHSPIREWQYVQKKKKRGSLTMKEIPNFPHTQQRKSYPCKKNGSTQRSSD